ncbi:DUF1310 family protein [Streptococcus intermedius]|uniref:DUF1310 family protein n=1 Tax=Streptococcus intermedius TaxID=1338 RepID=UPI0002329562|nr:DUF1310 family protein [Streptococcus intermedius]EHG14110.1 hypothetical protein HMPREF9177_00164 [Streptococcus intermedius F0413]QKH78475.1 DUF1310 family protein [Streptococcus intermedius]
MKKPLKIIGIVMASILAIGIVIIGGYKIMQKVEHDQMVKIVKSDEVQMVIEKRLRIIDSKAFTSEGVIQSYEVDYNSVKHNPMGGIMVKIYVNHKKENLVTLTLVKETTDNKIHMGSSSVSKELRETIENNE